MANMQPMCDECQETPPTTIEASVEEKSIEPVEDLLKGISKSEPLPVSQEQMLVKQRSAPAHLFILDQNTLPPFRRPAKDKKPRILTWSFLTREQTVNMVRDIDSEGGDTQKVFTSLLLSRNVLKPYELEELNFLLLLLQETYNFAAGLGFDARKLSTLFAIYVDAHLYFKSYYWRTPEDLWNYFQETVMRHAIDDGPDGQEVFDPDESYDIITHFHTLYLSNLPLVHILTFGAHRLKLTWPFNIK